MIGKSHMSKNNKGKREPPKIYSKEVKKNLDDLEWQKTQFQSNQKPVIDNIQEIRLRTELIKYLNSELAIYQQEVNLLKQSLKENRVKIKTT
jgi:hypothetical protein